MFAIFFADSISFQCLRSFSSVSVIINLKLKFHTYQHVKQIFGLRQLQVHAKWGGICQKPLNLHLLRNVLLLHFLNDIHSSTLFYSYFVELHFYTPCRRMFSQTMPYFDWKLYHSPHYCVLAAIKNRRVT